MEKEVVKDGEKALAIVLRAGDFPEGLNFYTQDSDFVQVATWHYSKRKKSSVHNHNIVDRTANRTQEVIYIKNGKIKLSIFTEGDEICEELILSTGDVAIIFAGGHGMEVLEDGTQAIEIKNGPYPGIEKDKRNIQ